MIPTCNGADVLSLREKETIHRNALRILAEVGLQVEHAEMLDALAGYGLPVDAHKQRVYFPTATVEAFLAGCPKIDWAMRVPDLSVTVATFIGYYLDPDTGEYRDWTPELLDRYWTLAHNLPEVNGMSMLGCAVPVPAAIEPLYERFLCWKYGAYPGGTLHPFSAAEAIWDLVQAYADLKGKTPTDVFTGCCFIMSPLRFAAEEAKQFWYWHQRGMKVSLSNMTTGGLTAPATIAGQVALHIAEKMAIYIIRHALYGTQEFYLMTAMAPADMRTAARPCARPESAIANMVMASMARWYGVGTYGQSGMTDAKEPSQEVAAQRMMGAMANLLAGADATFHVGQLSTDYVFSPIQAVLDNEYAGALQRFRKNFEISDESIGFEMIKEVGPAGLYIDHPHTLEHFREEYWHPQIWQRDQFNAWDIAGRKSDVAIARERYAAIMENPKPGNQFTEAEERALLAIIDRVRKVNV